MRKKLVLFLVFCFLSLTSFSAELLVKANGNWVDELTQKEIDAMVVEQRQSSSIRYQKGDIITVRPDSWEWGEEECLPKFIIIKVPDMTIEEAKKYEESLIDYSDNMNPKVIRIRKYNLNKGVLKTTLNDKYNSVMVDKKTIESCLIIKAGLAT